MSRDSSFESGQTYTFGSVTLNIGNMYNPKTGTVQIPSSGNYAVTWHVLTDGGYASYPYLTRNGGYIGIAACDARGSRGVRSACGNIINNVLSLNMSKFSDFVDRIYLIELEI